MVETFMSICSFSSSSSFFLNSSANSSFSSAFYQKFTKSDGKQPRKEKVNKEKDDLTNVIINEEIIMKKIGELKEFSAPGPDGVPAKVYIMLKEEIATPLAILFRRSLEEGRIPEDWREANVTPIFKKGKKHEPGNYRPVSLTNIACKVMERVIKDSMVEYLEGNNVTSKTQHGFRPGRSCVTNMIEFFDQVTKWTDDGESVDIAYFDFSKAFDKVCHERMIIKVEAAGITGKVKEWLKDWLRGRKQRVVIDGEFSDWREVLSSVIQGSVLGGTLFTIYIDDLDDKIKSLIRKFADDTKMAMRIKTKDDQKAMQDDIDQLHQWAEEWQMQFNKEKCKIMHVGNGNPMVKYEMDGKEMQVTESEKDLGVMVENTLKPTMQCQKAARKANAILGQISRSFHYRKKVTMTKLYKTFVRPHLEYAVTVWCPWLEKDIEELEKVQKRAVKMMSDVKGKTYEERLKELEMTTLSERRGRGDLIETYKVMRGHSRVDKNEWFKIMAGDTARGTRATTSITEEGEERRTDIIYKEKAKQETRKNFFTLRVARKWNQLPEEVKQAKTVNEFKNKYDEWAEEKRHN
jgi:ribonuclease P/MRP protein subunit RPP40